MKKEMKLKIMSDCTKQSLFYIGGLMINKNIDSQIIEWINKNKKYIIENWMELIKIPSVKSDAQEKAPFGLNCAKVLEESIKLFSKESSTKTQLFRNDGYALAEYNANKSDKTIGIFSHSDVVPAGEGWKYTNPFEPVIIDGSLIGRGCEDNKSGIMAALCLIKFISDYKIDIKSKIQVFIGSDEECGMADLKAYLKAHNTPDLSFVPDADFPCSVGEKGIYHFNVKSKKDFTDIVEFTGGEAANIVLDKVVAKIRFSDNLLSELISLTKNSENICIDKSDDYILITSTGVSKHASIPEGSLNAAHITLELLSKCHHLNADDKDICKKAAHLISDNYGKGIGVTNEDPVFGKMTSVNGICRTESHRLIMSFDVRYGDTLNSEFLETESEKYINSYDFDVCDKENRPGFLIDKNSNIPDVLEDIYNEISNQNLKRVVMSGGTYARRLPNAFSIGTSIVTKEREDKILKMPDGHGGMHQRDERIDIQAFFEAVRVLIHYVIECDKLINL